MSKLAEIATRRRIARLESQAQRIRNRLASAWDRGCSEEVIHRLEESLRDRWKMLDRVRQYLH